MGDYPYEVIERIKELPMYKVQKRSEEGRSKTRKLHRNLLFPLLQKECDSQGEADVEVMDIEPKEKYSQCMKDPLHEAGPKDKH